MQVFFQGISSHSLDLSYCVAFYLLPQSFPALFPTQMLAVRFEEAIHVSPVLFLLQRDRVSDPGGKGTGLQYELVLTVSLYGTYIS